MEQEGSLEISIQKERMVLLPNGGLFWPSKGALFIADLHLGKANHFRKAGIPIPLKVQEQNLMRLKMSMRETGCDQVFFLGDLFHSEWNTTWDLFADIVSETTDIGFHLVEGNHDILEEERYKAAGLTVYEEGLIMGPFQLNHHPREEGEAFRLCGHVHPSVKLRGRGRQTLRLPCFIKSVDQMILPAFGGFTGQASLKPKEADQVFVLSDGKVIRV
ncbi:MAG: ligase-associated DNA damage response endonuclease PdeM [Saprospiraceae bacterium]|nr:ligase-associated DNA damage response endonuclease PdeM [Saprospiraceae bacterium]